MPVPEPPDPAVQELLGLLTVARAQLRTARTDLIRAQRLNEYVSAPASMTVRVMLRTRAFAVDVWADEVRALEEHARSMGLQP